MKSVDVFDYGATPLSSIRSTVDVMVSGPGSPKCSQASGRRSKRRLENVRGPEIGLPVVAAKQQEINICGGPREMRLSTEHLAEGHRRPKFSPRFRGVRPSIFRNTPVRTAL